MKHYMEPDKLLEGLVWQRVLINPWKKAPRGNFLGTQNPPPPRWEGSPAGEIPMPPFGSSLSVGFGLLYVR